MTQPLRELWLARVVACGSPPVCLASLVVGVMGIVGGEGIGYMLVILGLITIAMGIICTNALRALRGVPTSSPQDQDRHSDPTRDQ